MKLTSEPFFDTDQICLIVHEMVTDFNTVEARSILHCEFAMPVQLAKIPKPSFMLGRLSRVATPPTWP